MIGKAQGIFIEMPMVEIPGGKYFIGSKRSEVEGCIREWSDCLLDSDYTPRKFRSWIEKEYPMHEVELASFLLAKYPVTNFQFRLFLEEMPFVRRPESIQIDAPADHPVWGVTVEEANIFARWWGRKTRKPYRLPKEHEWECAARGSSRRQYPYGDTFCPTKANTFESKNGATTPVTRYDAYPSEFGVCDMAGNVEEWVDDIYRPYPGGRFIQDDLTTELGSSYPILRGGSFARGGDLSRAARRHGPYPGPEFCFVGFRLALDRVE